MQVSPRQEFNELLNSGNVFDIVITSGSIAAVGTLDNVVIFNETITSSRTIGSYEHDVQFKFYSLGGIAEVNEVRSSDFDARLRMSADEIKGIINPKTGIIVPFGLIADGVPNVTLTNAIGTTETAFSFVTISGGTMGATSQLEIRHTLTKAGTTAGDVRLRFGPASGSFGTATAFGGQGGLTTQVFLNYISEIWNNGTLNTQFATAVAIGGGLALLTTQ
jgi:hypothetical protein